MDVSRLRSVATAVIGFFGFLFAFLSVASALGRGLQGFGLSVLIGGIVASGLFLIHILHWQLKETGKTRR